MRKFVSSMVLSMIMTLVSVAVIFLLQAPLLTFVYYGFFADGNSTVLAENVINRIVNNDAMTVVILLVQSILTLAFVFALFFFIRKVIFVFLSDEKLVRGYYIGFFAATLIVPVIMIFLSVFTKGKLWIIVLLTVELISTVLNTVLLVFTAKILPETTDAEYRKYLFTNGVSNE